MTTTPAKKKTPVKKAAPVAKRVTPKTKTGRKTAAAMRRSRSKAEPQSWQFNVEEGVLCQIVKSPEGKFLVATQFTPRVRTCDSYEEAADEVPIISALLREQLDLQEEIQGWMDPEPPPEEGEPAAEAPTAEAGPSRSIRRAARIRP